MENSTFIGYSHANQNVLPATKLRVLNTEVLSEINGGISIAGLVSSAFGGAVAVAIRGIVGGPAGMFAGAIFGAGMGMAVQAARDAADIHDRNKK